MKDTDPRADATRPEPVTPDKESGRSPLDEPPPNVLSDKGVDPDQSRDHERRPEK